MASRWFVLVLLLAACATAMAEPVVRALQAARPVLKAGKAGDGLRLSLEMDTRAVHLVLAEDDSLLQAMPGAERARIARTGLRLYAGHPAGRPSGWVRMVEQAGAWSGAWSDGEDLWLLEPAGQASAGRPASARGHVAYRLRDVTLPGLAGDQHWHTYPPIPAALRPQPSAPAAAKAALREMDLSVVTDPEFTALHGSSRDAIVLGRVSVIDGIYTDQLGLRVRLAHLHHLDQPHTLTPTNGSALLGAFRTFMTGGAGSTLPKGAVTHLFSGKDFDGSVAGVAYVGTLCSTGYGYGVDQVRSASMVTAVIIAHEMGHNLGAEHDGEAGSVCADQTGSGWIMRASVSGSSTTFSPCSLATVQPRIEQASCLRAISTGAGIYADGFEG